MLIRYVQRLVSIPNTTTDFDSSKTMPYVSFNTLLYSKEVRTWYRWCKTSLHILMKQFYFMTVF